MTQRKKQGVLVAAAVAALLWGMSAWPVMAGNGTQPTAQLAKPAPTSPGYVALLYHRLTGQQPDVEAWAMASDDYSGANGFDKDLVRREKAAEVVRAYHLITYDQPVVIEHAVTLSSYSRTRRGFFVQNFKPDTFYDFEFLGRNYALVPLDLLDYQWISLESEEAMQRMNEQVNTDSGVALMYLYVMPVSADKDKPMHVNDKDYWLMSGRVKKMQIYDKGGTRLLWEGVSREEAEQNRKHVLELYK